MATNLLEAGYNVESHFSRAVLEKREVYGQKMGDRVLLANDRCQAHDHEGQLRLHVLVGIRGELLHHWQDVLRDRCFTTSHWEFRTEC